MLSLVNLEPGLDNIRGEDQGPESDPGTAARHHCPQRSDVFLLKKYLLSSRSPPPPQSPQTQSQPSPTQFETQINPKGTGADTKIL